MMPKAWRLRAKGSFSPVGWSPIPQIPTKVSNLSARARVSPTRVLGRVSPEKRGR